MEELNYDYNEYEQLKYKFNKSLEKSQNEINQLKVINAKLEKDIDELVNYQRFAEENMRRLYEKNTNLDKQISAITNILEMTKYLNSSLNEQDLIPKINDMLIGILGVTKSSIYLFENSEIEIKYAKFGQRDDVRYREKLFTLFENNEPFVLNSRMPIFDDGSNTTIHSVIGVPIFIREKIIGYLIVEHTRFDFFGYENIKFISTAAAQIGVSLENYFLYNKVKESAFKDPLLPVFTRRHFFDLVDEQIKNNKEKEFAIVMLDIDNFKKCNDDYGHLFGDQVLIQVAKVIKNSLGEEDILARYGGEEMVIFLDDASDRDLVFKKVDTIREKIQNNIVMFGEISNSVTSSFGISYYPYDGDNIEKVLNVADKRLYEAKRLGKNRVISL
ncbi:MAG: diguanylate cyclase [Clostridiaceae bacterium]